MSRTLLHVWYAVTAGAWRDAPGRAAISVFGIACGVALGVAVHLINATARNEFELAARTLSGEADLVIRGPRQGFAEALYPKIAHVPEVDTASPAVEMEAALTARRESVKVVGVDLFRAAGMQPSLIGTGERDITQLLNRDNVWLSQAAAETLGIGAGHTLELQVGTRSVPFHVVAVMPEEAYRGELVIMDIATAQWRLQQLGRLQRIDVRLRPGTNAQVVAAKIRTMLPAGVEISRPETDVSRGTAMSRAYRLNLDMLALVALFTGSFLVFTTQFLALMRRRAQFAVLRVFGMTQPVLQRFLLLEGALLGAVGSALGLYAGYELARYVVRHVGIDLGAGYFRAFTPAFTAEPAALAAYFALGVASSVLGAAPPSFEISRRAPALALKAGDQEDAEPNPRMAVLGVVLIAIGAMLTAAPDSSGVPAAGYVAIALLLLGTIAVLPAIAARVLRLVRAPRELLASLALAQLQAGPRRAAISIAAIVASFSLMVSMLIMVTSFRASLEAWLTHMLPADVYLRTSPLGETGFLDPGEQERIRSTPGVARVTFLRSQTLVLSATHPPVTLLARPIDATHAGETLPLQSSISIPRAPAPPPVWVSEAAQDLYGWKPGDEIALPVGARSVRFTVAGIWRDYARQNGSVVMDRDLYVRLTDDRLVNDAAIWLAPGSSATEVSRALRERLDAWQGLEIAETGAIRARSLAIFDRTFAVTYALETAAVLIGLFGVSSAFGAQALARRREFGVLRHLGMTRRQIGVMLACEGGLIAAFGAAVGLLLGWVIGLVLIRVINRQSFHWSMDLHLPLLQLAILTVVLLAASAVTAAWSGRYAMRAEAARAVREDW